MPTLGQPVFYYSQPDATLLANPAWYLGVSLETPGKAVLLVAWAPGGLGGVTNVEATLVTENPAVGDYAETQL